MQDFIEIAKTDFADTFGGAMVFPFLLLAVAFILWQEKELVRKLLLGVLPLFFLFLYWCPVTGLLFMKLLGENVYWRLLWLLPLAVTVPYAACLLLARLQGKARQGAFFLLLAVLVLGGQRVLSTEWFEPSTNAYKVPQNVIEVCGLLPDNVHALVSNRLMPYIRQCNPTITLAYGRNFLDYNTREADSPKARLYQEVQKPEIDVGVAGPLAREEGCTFLVLSSSRTYVGDWSDYGYQEYGHTDEFTIFAEESYEEGQDTRKWEE